MEINVSEDINRDSNSPESPETKKNNTIAYISLAVIAVLGILLGILGLTKSAVSLDDAFQDGFESGTKVEGYAEYGNNSYTVDLKNSINFIPVCHEYYFIIFSDNMRSAVAVRAPKSFGKKFDESFEANELVRIKGKVRKLPSKVKPTFNELSVEAAESGLFVEDTLYVDLMSTRLNIIELIIGVGNLIVLVNFAVNQRRKTRDLDLVTSAGKGSALFNGLVLIVCAVLILYLTMML